MGPNNEAPRPERDDEDVEKGWRMGRGFPVRADGGSGERRELSKRGPGPKTNLAHYVDAQKANSSNDFADFEIQFYNENSKIQYKISPIRCLLYTMYNAMCVTNYNYVRPSPQRDFMTFTFVVLPPP